ncbi:MAG: monovalent cation/H+ antiporter complex subunit F [Pseudomonadota bacterium]
MTLLSLSADLATWILLLAAALTVLRLILGPTVADRAVAIDMLSVLTVGFAGLRAIAADETAYLDIALVLAIAGFLATLAFARFIMRSHARGSGVAGARGSRPARTPGLNPASEGN